MKYTLSGKAEEKVECIKKDLENQLLSYLTLKCNYHNNVEICSSISAVKYLYKYVYKGHDMTMIRLQRHDDNNDNGVILPPPNEIQQYSTARYVTGNEAILRLFEKKNCIIR